MGRARTQIKSLSHLGQFFSDYDPPDSRLFGSAYLAGAVAGGAGINLAPSLLNTNSSMLERQCLKQNSINRNDSQMGLSSRNYTAPYRNGADPQGRHPLSLRFDAVQEVINGNSQDQSS
jgi:hypothetical protein